MQNVANCRDDIFNFFDENNDCQIYFKDPKNAEKYATYWVAMYLIQDTSGATILIREKGFSGELMAYIEFWGLMQAIIIQQDSISELYKVITDNDLNTKKLVSWKKIRQLRNTCAGHPAKKEIPKSSPLTRTFMARDFGSYSEIQYEKWESPGTISHPKVQLGSLIDNYAREAGYILGEILKLMKKKWGS